MSEVGRAGIISPPSRWGNQDAYKRQVMAAEGYSKGKGALSSLPLFRF